MSYLARFIRELKDQNYYILDTETTGLDRGEIVQIAIIDHKKEIILDTLVKPKMPIPADVSAIHGIFDVDCEQAPIWPDISPLVREILEGQNVIIYNAVYDRKMMHQTAERHEMEKIDWKAISKMYCAMLAYAENYGEFNAYRGNYKWQRLQMAATRLGYMPQAAHTALSDCLTTWHVVEMLLVQNPEKAEAEFMGESEEEQS